ncbi:C40 family peptidase [Candidatus Pelagibacter sp.]|nr:C40 family peptidase [Candidatus Pelagibacter sp.]
MNNKFYYINNLNNIYSRPTYKSEITSQILYGEKFSIISKNKSWIKIKTKYDNYIGYIIKKKFVKNFITTHKICKKKTKIYKKLKNKFIPLKKEIYFASKILVLNKDKSFIEFEKGKWIKKKDIKKIDHKENNFVKIFKLFLDTKYSWGGKTCKGIDCSAILQLFFYYNNKFYPRDTKDQIRYSKKNIKKSVFKKGDIIFWKGHVAICINSKKLIHAYGPEKKVLIMPITKTINRIERTTNLVVKRVSSIKY